MSRLGSKFPPPPPNHHLLLPLSLHPTPYTMGIGHVLRTRFVSVSKKQGQGRFFDSKNYLSYGGDLRKKRKGRKQRPLSRKHPLHLVFKVNKSCLQNKNLRHPKCFSLIHQILNRWSHYFGVRVEQLSIQKDHIHILVRSSSRYQFRDFFRVMAGQIAQRFEQEGYLSVTDTPGGGKGTGLWKHRPFTRIVVGWKAYSIVRNYIQLNEKEALGVIPYRKTRLRGLSMRDWQLLWS